VKRQGHLYERICELDNIKLAMRKASLGKRHHSRVARVLADQDRYAKVIQCLLLEQTFVPGTPKIKTIFDGASGKTRQICRPAFFPDQIVHWALMLQVTDVIMRGMYEHNCGSIPGRGTSYGQKRLRAWLDRQPKQTRYCLKMDIAKFYPSVKGVHLKAMFRRKIKDARCLWLIDTIIDSADGLPIGYYTSQWFANFFLEDLDHFIKEQLQIPFYIRYIDDLVLLGPNKKKLHAAHKAIETFLAAKGLAVKQDWQVFPTRDRAIDFLGVRFFHDRTILRKRTSLRIRRRVGKIRRKHRLDTGDAAAMLSYWGWLKRTDSHSFYHLIVRPTVSIAAARKVVSISATRRPRQVGQRQAGSGIA